MQKVLFVLFIAVLAQFQSKAQVKFNLELLPDNKTYVVSAVAEETYTAPKNMVASAQIVLRFNTVENFIPVIESKIPGLTWSDNAMLDHNDPAVGVSFVCVTLVEKSTKLIPFEKGQKTPLFSFKNADGSCPGVISLVENTDADVLECRRMGYNITQNMSILGARGDAFLGLENKFADCAGGSTTTAAPEVQVSKITSVEVLPSPASTTVAIKWSNVADFSQELNLMVFDGQGKEVKRSLVSSKKGENMLNIDVRSWEPGLYQFFFRNEEQKITKAYRFVVAR